MRVEARSALPPSALSAPRPHVRGLRRSTGRDAGQDATRAEARGRGATGSRKRKKEMKHVLLGDTLKLLTSCFLWRCQVWRKVQSPTSEQLNGVSLF